MYYTTNQEEILLAKETLQQVIMEMQQVENKAKKDNTISVAKEIGSFGISLIPLVGDGKDLQESISGLDLITGKKLSALERVLAGACVIVPVVSGSMVRIAGKNAEIAEKISLLSEKQLFKKVGKGIVMCEDAKKEMEQLIREVRNMLEEDADIKRLFAKNKNTGLQVEIAGVGKVSLEEQTKQAFNLRNQFRTQARELMADRATAESLYKTDPNLTWEEIVRKQSAKGLEGDDI